MNSSDFMTRPRVEDAPSEPVKPSPRKNSKHSPTMKLVMSVMLVSLALLVLAVLALLVFGRSTDEDKLIKADKYQAVFLDDANGQVYIGKLHVINSQYYSLTNAFYVQAGQIPATEDGTSNQSVSLVPLGTQLHGPENEMFIAKDKVLFWENLKDDGKAAKAITNYNTTGSTTSDTTTDTTTE